MGKELAESLLRADKKSPDWSRGNYHMLSGSDMDVGGQGMNYAYNNMYPQQFKKLLRQLDKEHPGRQETRLVPSNFDPKGMTDVMGNLSGRKYEAYLRDAWGGPFENPFHYFALTPKVKEAIERGLPLFGSGGEVDGTEILRDYYGKLTEKE